MLKLEKIYHWCSIGLFLSAYFLRLPLGLILCLLAMLTDSGPIPVISFIFIIIQAIFWLIILLFILFTIYIIFHYIFIFLFDISIKRPL